MMASADHDPRRAGVIWTFDLDEPAPSVQPLLPTTFRRLGPEYAGLLAETQDGSSSEEILRRFQTGRRCYSAWVQEKLCAYGWVSFDEEMVGELDLRIRLLPGEAYIWDCFTLPTYRQQHLYSAVLIHILGELRADGFRRAWIGADLDNLPSQHGIARAGFTAVADLVVERVNAMRFVWAQGRTGVSPELVDEARRVYLNDRDKVWLQAVQS